MMLNLFPVPVYLPCKLFPVTHAGQGMRVCLCQEFHLSGCSQVPERIKHFRHICLQLINQHPRKGKRESEVFAMLPDKFEQ